MGAVSSPDETAPSRAGLELLKLIPPDAKIVLEVGCGNGLLGKRYKRVNPHGLYVACESDPDAVAEARDHLDVVVEADPELLEIDSVGVAPGQIDCVIYCNTLERTGDPWSMVKRQARWLSKNGVVLAAVANGQHWRTLRDLIRGREETWDGLFRNQGDARPFTLDGLRRLFEAADMNPLDTVGLGQESEEFERFHNALRPTVDALGLDPRQFETRSKVECFIVRATHRAASIQPLLIQSMVLKPVGAVNDKRIHEPNQLLATIPGVRVFTSQGGANLKKPTKGTRKVFIWHRPILRRPGSIDGLRTLLRNDYLVIVDFDDDPRHWPEIPEHDFLTFRGVHAVQTSTNRLADYLRQFNPNVAVFENHMVELPSLSPKVTGGPVEVFFGALNRAEDWAPIMPALNRVLEDYADGVHVRVIHDRAFFDELRTERKTFEPSCSYGRYLDIIGKCHIGLLPLLATEFNSYKSDIKFVEHAASGAVALASPTVYQDSIEEDVTGLIFHSPEKFEAKLRLLIDRPIERERIAENARAWVRDQRLMGQHYRERYEWYLRLLDDRPKLNDELRKRVPELFSSEP